MVSLNKRECQYPLRQLQRGTKSKSNIVSISSKMLTLHWNAFEYNKGIAVEIRTGKRRLGECGCPMRIGTAFEQAEKEKEW